MTLLHEMGIFAAAAFAALTVAGESYNIFFVSDLHFGEKETFEVVDPASGKLRTRKDPNRLPQIMPAMRAMFKRMAEQCDDKTAFVVQGGDLVEGWAKDKDAHAAQLKQGLGEITSALKVPVIGVNGNHDANGKFGRAAFNEVMLPYMRRVLNQPDLSDPSDFTIRKGDDLWIFTDYFSAKPAKTRLDYPLRVLRELKWKPRYVFLVVHTPLLQLPNGKHVRMMNELAKYRSFVLCGHTHQNMLLVAKRPQGTIVQFTVNTLLKPDVKQDRFTKIINTKELFLPQLKRRTEKWKVWDKVQVELVPFISQVWYAKGAGYAKLDVSDAGVRITVQSVDLTQAPIVIYQSAK